MSAIFMYCIFASGLLTLGAALERAIALYIHYKIPPNDFRKRVLEFIVREDLAGAENYARQEARETSIGRVFIAACEQQSRTRMDEQLAEEVSHIDRRTGLLAIFGNLATFFGLLGTIVGILHAFSAVAQVSPADRPTQLSQGISEAMNCTALGLLVAIPALIAFVVFQNKTERLISALTEQATEIYHDMIFLSETSQSKKHKEASKSQVKAPAPAPTLDM